MINVPTLEETDVVFIISLTGAKHRQLITVSMMCVATWEEMGMAVIISMTRA